MHERRDLSPGVHRAEGEKARVFFENGQVRHATAPGKEGIEAFNEIVNWKGGMISEVQGAGPGPRTIDLDWQILLMEAVRKIDETPAQRTDAAAAAQSAPARRKILVIDDSVMLLNFVKEILSEANYDVVAAATAEEGLRAAAGETPHLILLDYVLPDMKGDEVLSRLRERTGDRAGAGGLHVRLWHRPAIRSEPQPERDRLVEQAVHFRVVA